MDLEKMQKINALANEFKKHKFATCNEEAFKQAASVYDPTKKAEQKEEPKTIKIDSGLNERKMELMLEINNRKYEHELTTLRTAINTLNKELQDLRTEIRTMPRPEKKAQQELKTEPKEPHPKRGDFTSDDVDIKKMFYFGTKR